MDCDEVRVQISALMDDNQEVQVKDIHDHLGSCSSCSKFYEGKLKVTEWLKEAENFQLEPPPGIWERIDSEITPKTETSGKKPTPPAKK